LKVQFQPDKPIPIDAYTSPFGETPLYVLFDRALHQGELNHAQWGLRLYNHRWCISSVVASGHCVRLDGIGDLGEEAGPNAVDYPAVEHGLVVADVRTPHWGYADVFQDFPVRIVPG
jgi:hypothetical protein